MPLRLTILTLLLSLRIAAQPPGLDSVLVPYILETDHPVQSLDNHLYVLVDSTNGFALDFFMNNDEWYSGLSKYTEEPQYGVDNTIWGFIKISSKIDLSETWELHFEGSAEIPPGWASGNSEIDVYEFSNDDKVKIKRSGSDIPRREKDIKSRWNKDRVSFESKRGEEKLLLIRVRDENSLNGPDFGLVLKDLSFKPYQQFIQRYTTSQNIILGITLIAFLYHLILFLFTRDRALGWFTLWLLCVACSSAMVHNRGLFTETFLFNAPKLRWVFWTIFANGVWLVFWQFGRTFGEIKKYNPGIDKWIRGVLYYWAVLLILILFDRIFLRAIILENTGIMFRSLGLVGYIVGLGIVAALFIKGKPLGKAFAVGALIGVTAPFLGVLWSSQVLHLPFDPYVAGFLIQLLLYSLALAYRMKIQEQEKQEAMRLKELDAIKSRFFANISHEFRTPLTLIVSPLRQLASGNYEGDSNALFKTMQNNGDRLLNLVNQLLDLSKLESGKMKLQVEKGDVVQFLKTLVFSFDSMAERRQIHFQTHFPDTTHLSFFDRNKLEKIVVNLLSNAFKYTPERGHVSVLTEVENNRLRISIEDSGPGISKEELDKIFDRFYQVEGTEDKGTGIGLSLVKELVDLHRGTIQVNSAPGKGTEFKVSLPIAYEDFESSEMKNINFSEKSGETILQPLIINGESSLDENGLPGDNDKPIALVVEDNTDLRAYISSSLEKDFNVVTSENGKEGKKLAIKHIPDIIVSDVMMPEMNGLEMTNALKKEPATSHIPVILLTAKGGQENKITGLETGADDYLTKPFEVRELLVRAHNLINNRNLLKERYSNEITLKPKEVAVTSVDEKFLTRITEIIEKEISNEQFGVTELAREIGMSRSQLHRKLTAICGKSANQIIRNFRLERARDLLKKQAGNVGEIAFEVGFNSRAYFAKCFKDAFGISPSEV